MDLILLMLGAASDKVAALEKAGVIVTDSPAKIGAMMLKVRAFQFISNNLPTVYLGRP
jgi:succinyl-CoA synthetase alpha subunit